MTSKAMLHSQDRTNIVCFAFLLQMPIPGGEGIRTPVRPELPVPWQSNEALQVQGVFHRINGDIKSNL